MRLISQSAIATLGYAALALSVCATHVPEATASGMLPEHSGRDSNSPVGFVVTPTVDYSTGGYGLKQKTRSVTTSLSVSCSLSNWTLTAYLPHQYISTPGGVTIINRRPVATLGAMNQPRMLARLETTTIQNRAMSRRQRQSQIDQIKAPRESYSGFGDAELSVDYGAFESADGGWSIALNGVVKFPSGDEEKGLGTGETDYRIGTTISRSFSRMTAFVTVGHSVMGKPADSDLRNYSFGGVGISYATTELTDMVVTFFSYQRSSESTGDSHELSLEVQHRFSDRWSFRTYGLVGLSTSAPELGGGLSLSCSL